MNNETESILRSIIKKYFANLSVLVAQIPFEIRGLLLPPYMLYIAFKSQIYIGPSGRIAFEIQREKGSRFSIKSRKISQRIEEEIFGVLGTRNMIRLNGTNSILSGGVLTCNDFKEKHGYMLPKNTATLNFTAPGLTGPIEIGKEAEVKIIDCGIYWIVKKKRFTKTISFAWLFGNRERLTGIDPILHSESDFYSYLFHKLYEIITFGYRKPVDMNARSKVLSLYQNLISNVEAEFRKQIFSTNADEQVLQRLLVKYKFFLYPKAISIESQPVLRGMLTRRPDFHIQKNETEHIYVEIEPPFFKSFKKCKKTSRLKGALKQVSDWKKILNVKANEQIVRYIIIIGLLDDFSKEERKALHEFNKVQTDTVVITWDYVLNNIIEVKRRIENMPAHARVLNNS